MKYRAGPVIKHITLVQKKNYMCLHYAKRGIKTMSGIMSMQVRFFLQMNSGQTRFAASCVLN